METSPTPSSTEPAERELLSPARAAQIAGRSVRTIRRAYGAGRLVAYRDGSGRGVRISYRDLRLWMMSEQLGPSAPPAPPAPPHPGADLPGLGGEGRNLALIRSARRRRD